MTLVVGTGNVFPAWLEGDPATLLDTRLQVSSAALHGQVS